MRWRGLTAALATVAALLASPPPAMAALPSGACAMPMGDVGRTDWELYLRPAGTVKAIMLFVDFSDDQAQTSPDSYVERLRPAEKWFEVASGGKFALDITAHKHWHRMPKPSSDYDLDGNLTYESHRAYLRDAVNATDNHVNFAGYDLLYVVSPRTAQNIPISPAFMAYEGGGIREDGHEIRHGAVIGQDMWNPGWGRHLLVHETGHTFGLPDLYAYDSGELHRFAGGWDIMGSIDGPGRDFTVWHKWKMG